MRLSSDWSEVAANDGSRSTLDEGSDHISTKRGTSTVVKKGSLLCFEFNRAFHLSRTSADSNLQGTENSAGALHCSSLHRRKDYR